MREQSFLPLIISLWIFAMPLGAQQTALKTNTLFWATTTPNVGVEVGIDTHFTLDLWGAYNTWKFGNDMKLNFYLIQPEARYWLCRKYEGHFFGLHGHYGHFNIGNIPFISGLSEHVLRGNLYGGGLTYGYHWALGERWGMEAMIGGGYTPCNTRNTAVRNAPRRWDFIPAIISDRPASVSQSSISYANNACFMKRNTIQLLIALLCVTCSALLTTEEAAGQRIRVVTRSVGISDDSLRIRIDMDLNNVQTGSSMSVTFTPILQQTRGKLQRLALPPVVVTGRQRARTDRRERFLSPQKAGPAPYVVLFNNGKSKVVDYRVSIPFASWMKQASLLLRQEYKDCCDAELLGVDTLKQNIALTGVPRTETAETAPTATVAVASARTVAAPVSVAVQTIPVIPFQAAPLAVAWNAADLNQYAPMVSFLLPDATGADKNHEESTVLYIDYPLGRDDVHPDYKNISSFGFRNYAV